MFEVSLLEYWLLRFGSVNTQTDTSTGTLNSALVTNQPTLILYSLCNTKMPLELFQMYLILSALFGYQTWYTLELLDIFCV